MTEFRSNLIPSTSNFFVDSLIGFAASKPSVPKIAKNINKCKGISMRVVEVHAYIISSHDFRTLQSASVEGK